MSIAISQSGNAGGRPGPVLGHWCSAARHNGLAILTSAARHVPSVTRARMIWISVSGYVGIVTTPIITYGDPCAYNVKFPDGLGYVSTEPVIYAIIGVDYSWPTMVTVNSTNPTKKTCNLPAGTSGMG